MTIWDYEDTVKELLCYYMKLKVEFERRNFKFNYSKKIDFIWLLDNQYYDETYKPFKKHHNDKYLLQCFYNLQEKYDRVQRDFDFYTYAMLERFVRQKWSLK